MTDNEANEVGEGGVAAAAAPPWTPAISVVVPIYNEVENVAPLHEALTYALQALDRSYEIVLVDDGSTCLLYTSDAADE